MKLLLVLVALCCISIGCCEDEKPVNGAYVSFVGSNSPYEMKWVAPAVLGKSLERTKTTYPRILLITEPADPEHVKFMEEEGGWQVRIVPLIKNPFPQATTLKENIVITKMHMFNLTDFERIVYIDTDTVVVRNLDEMFECTGFCARPRGTIHGFNTGVLVLQPNQSLYNDMMDSIPFLSDMRHIAYPTDQELLMVYYKHTCKDGQFWLSKLPEVLEEEKDYFAASPLFTPGVPAAPDSPCKRLPYSYNYMPKDYYGTLFFNKHDDGSHPHILHYTKPWLFHSRRPWEWMWYPLTVYYWPWRNVYRELPLDLQSPGIALFNMAFVFAVSYYAFRYVYRRLHDTHLSQSGALPVSLSLPTITKISKLSVLAFVAGGLLFSINLIPWLNDPLFAFLLVVVYAVWAWAVAVGALVLWQVNRKPSRGEIGHPLPPGPVDPADGMDASFAWLRLPRMENLFAALCKPIGITFFLLVCPTLLRYFPEVIRTLSFVAIAFWLCKSLHQNTIHLLRSLAGSPTVVPLEHIRSDKQSSE